MKLDMKKFGITLLLSLVALTIISTILSSYSNIPVIKTGTSLFLIFLTVFIIHLFNVSSDSKLDKGEIVTVIVLGVVLILSAWALKNYLPDIFSSFPLSIKQLFSSIIG